MAGTERRNRTPKRTAQRPRNGRSPCASSSSLWKRSSVHAFGFLFPFLPASFGAFIRRRPSASALPSRCVWQEAGRAKALPLPMPRSAPQNAPERAGKPFPLHRPDCSGEALRRHPQALPGHAERYFPAPRSTAGRTPPPNGRDQLVKTAYTLNRQCHCIRQCTCIPFPARMREARCIAS